MHFCWNLFFSGGSAGISENDDQKSYMLTDFNGHKIDCNAKWNKSGAPNIALSAAIWVLNSNQLLWNRIIFNGKYLMDMDGKSDVENRKLKSVELAVLLSMFFTSVE